MSGCAAGRASAGGSTAAAVRSVAFCCSVGCIALGGVVPGCNPGGHGALVCGVAFCGGGGGHAFGAVASGLDDDRDVSATCALAGIVTGISADCAVIGVGEASVIFVVIGGALASLANGSFAELGGSRASVAVALASTVIGGGAEDRVCSTLADVMSFASGFAFELPANVAVNWPTDGICGTAT